MYIKECFTNYFETYISQGLFPMGLGDVVYDIFFKKL